MALLRARTGILILSGQVGGTSSALGTAECCLNREADYRSQMAGYDIKEAGYGIQEADCNSQAAVRWILARYSPNCLECLCTKGLSE